MSSTAPQQPRGPSILVVDDHGPCRDTTTRLLKALGYQVVAAADPEEAERALERPGHELDALIVDVCLTPRGDSSFACRLEAEHPHLPIVFVSGYSGDVCEALDLLAPHRCFLQKPFSLAQLESALAAVRAAALAHAAHASAA